MVLHVENSEPDARAYDEASEPKPSPSTSNAVPNNIKEAIPIPEDTEEKCKESVKFRPENLYYDMSGKKIMLIFSHSDYDKNYLYTKLKIEPRNTEEDVKALYDLFDGLGFKVKEYPNLEFDAIKNVARSICKEDHNSTSCVAVVILTHGGAGGELYARDKPYYLSEIIEIFQHDNLMNKPKLFFIQACRGNNVDAGKMTYYDGPTAERRLHVPTHVDFLISRSTVENYLSWREYWGSWYVRELCKVFKEFNEQMDILQMLTLVTKNVAYNHKSYHTTEPKLHEKKATPETRYTLTKLLKFSDVPLVKIESVRTPPSSLFSYSYVTGTFSLVAAFIAGFCWKY
ncbi:hypothetical protein ABMA27_013064 [Loxostege sticticalis]|uniref:Uncharacterized protein n=1 Tax=Loxostege sticticalis TaxID=481309 RepID=A0ABR3IDZ0_LOXSC